MDEYQPVWQTWNLVQQSHHQPLNIDNVSNAPTTGGERSCTGVDIRQMVQQARIQRRWSIDILASHVKCEPKTLAAFEREAEVLPPDVLERLRKILRIDDTS